MKGHSLLLLAGVLLVSDARGQGGSDRLQQLAEGCQDYGVRNNIGGENLDAGVIFFCHQRVGPLYEYLQKNGYRNCMEQGCSWSIRNAICWEWLEPGNRYTIACAVLYKAGG
jgi:hypothetical protein